MIFHSHFYQFSYFLIHFHFVGRAVVYFLTIKEYSVLSCRNFHLYFFIFLHPFKRGGKICVSFSFRILYLSLSLSKPLLVENIIYFFWWNQMKCGSILNYLNLAIFCCCFRFVLVVKKGRWDVCFFINFPYHFHMFILLVILLSLSS